MNLYEMRYKGSYYHFTTRDEMLKTVGQLLERDKDLSRMLNLKIVEI